MLALVLYGSVVKGQVNNYAVFFTDKSNSPYKIDQPQAFLSARAIDRRQSQQINVVEEDLPVNPVYIEGISGIGNVSVREQTKWLNGALIQATSAEAESLKLLPYVSNVVFIAPQGVGGRIEKKLDIESLTAYQSDTLFQFNILGVPQMRADGYDGNGIMIAIMDGGFEGMPTINAFDSLFIEGRVLMAYDFISRSSNVYQYIDHGTKVSSLLCAAQKSPDYVGVVPKASFLLFVTEDINVEYRLEEYRWLVAAEKADSAGVDIISSSLGYNVFDDPTMDYNKSQLDGNTAIITKAADKASHKGILVVTSGGNTGSSDPWENVLFPGDVIDGITVGSVINVSTPSSFSPRGPTSDGRIKPDVMALGSGTYLINKLGNIVTGSGTSFSTPLVAGLVAGIWQAHPDITSKELLTAMRESSSNALSPDNEMGYGIPSYQALNNFLQAEASTTWFAAFPNPVMNTNFLQIKIFDPVADNNVRFKMFDALGKPLTDDNLKITWQDNAYFLETTTLPRGIYILNLQSDSNFSQIKILKL